MQAERRDANERDIIDALRAIGAFVRQMSASAGFDLLVVFREIVHIAEIKMPGKHLTANEEITRAAVERAGGKYEIWHTPDEALIAIGATEE